jgi:hypothetical protein
MRKIMISLVMASAALTAVPATAQTWRTSPSVHREIRSDINQLDRRIERATERRTISRREAAGLRQQATNLKRLYLRFSRNGLDRREVAQLELQINRLHQRLRVERRDWDGRRG